MFSIIMPLYNKEKCVLNTIQTVMNQTFTDFELIIVNDGSTDNSLNIVKQITDIRVKVIEIANSGVSNARNTGINCSKYDIVCFLDADDFWEYNYLAKVKELFTIFPDAEVVAVNYDGVKEGVRHIEAPNLGVDGFKNYTKIAVETNYQVIWTSAVSIKKKCFFQFGMFNPNISYGEDLDLWFRLRNTKIVFTSEVLAHYNLSGDNNTWKDFKKKPLLKTFAYTLNYKNLSKIETLYLSKVIGQNLKYHLLARDYNSFYKLLIKQQFIGLKYILFDVFNKLNLFHLTKTKFNWFYIKCLIT